MDKEILTFFDIKSEKANFIYKFYNPIFLKNVDTEKVLVSI